MKFRGRTLYHCHILNHEDNGIMGVIEARQPAASLGTPPVDIPRLARVTR
ncbi:multicopper oxidase domain-containing protein [Mycetocola sp.]